MNINGIFKVLRRIYLQVVSSIAFLPVIIAIAFMILSWIMLKLDFSDFGKDLKASLELVRLKDASTARVIASTIAGAILSLTVFSFSLVMIILNQAASQISNRTLDSMISNRFQQWVLGFYIGTIVYALTLLSTIRDIESGIYVPALSIYLLILWAVFDIFLFIYFLHFVTQTVKYGTIINRIYNKTKQTLSKYIEMEKPETLADFPSHNITQVSCHESGYYQGFDQDGLVKWLSKRKARVRIPGPVSTYHIKGTPFLEWQGKPPSKEEIQELFSYIDFHYHQLPGNHYYFGFLHLSEIAIKALSPGVNDPGTAVQSLNAISDLFADLLRCHPPTQFNDKDGELRVDHVEWDVEKLFIKCIHPIWHYGKSDPYIRETMKLRLEQLIILDQDQRYRELFDGMKRKVIAMN